MFARCVWISVLTEPFLFFSFFGFARKLVSRDWNVERNAVFSSKKEEIDILVVIINDSYPFFPPAKMNQRIDEFLTGEKEGTQK